jgi:transposase-like protein
VGFFPLLEKPMARLPDQQLARQWRQRLDRFEHSDLTVARFCEVEGYSTASFYQWRRKLRDEKSSGDPAFIPVQFDASELSCAARRGFDIDLPGGATVKVPPGATSDERRELIADIVQATSDEVTL